MDGPLQRVILTRKTPGNHGIEANKLELHTDNSHGGGGRSGGGKGRRRERGIVARAGPVAKHDDGRPLQGRYR